MDTFFFPDGSAWNLPAEWGVKEYIQSHRNAFRTSAFLSLEHGDRWNSEDGVQTFLIPEGFVKKDVPLKSVEKPVRDRPISDGLFVDRDRLLSVLGAMIAGQPLPPVRVMERSGPMRVVNGFHRYFASVLLEYVDIPVLMERGGRLPASDLASIPDVGNDDVASTEVVSILLDNGMVSSELCYVVHNRRDATPTRQKQRVPEKSPRKPAWEPPSRRREREERERRERKRISMAKDLTQAMGDKRVKDMALVVRMREGGVLKSRPSYANVAGRK